MTDPEPDGGDVELGDSNEPNGPGTALERQNQPTEEFLEALHVVKKLAELEERRIAVQEGRNQVAMRALEVNENSDQRQFQFHTERIASEERGRSKAQGLARTVVIYGGGAAILLVAFVMLMAFFGNEAQSSIAMTMVREGAKAIGGAGFLFLLAAGVRRLLRS